MIDLYPPPGYFLRVKDWDTYFERAQTRKVKSPLSWIAVPTRHDGSKFRNLLSRTKHDQGIKTFGVFILLVEIAARMPARGEFHREVVELIAAKTDATLPDFRTKVGNPGLIAAKLAATLTCSDLARIVGCDRRSLDAAVKLLLLPEFNWLELVECSRMSTTKVVERSDMREEERRIEERREEALPPPALSEAEEEEEEEEEERSHPAVLLYLERFGPHGLSDMARREIGERVGEDLSGWKATLNLWQLNRHNAERVGNILDRYEKEFKRISRSGSTKPAVEGCVLCDQTGYRIVRKTERDQVIEAARKCSHNAEIEAGIT